VQVVGGDGGGDRLESDRVVHLTMQRREHLFCGARVRTGECIKSARAVPVPE
jgi:hypothetical protein